MRGVTHRFLEHFNITGGVDREDQEIFLEPASSGSYWYCILNAIQGLTGVVQKSVPPSYHVPLLLELCFL